MQHHQGRPPGMWPTDRTAEDALTLYTPPKRENPGPARRSVERTSEDAMTLYLSEISRVPLLTAEQEIALASRIAAGTPAAAALAQAGLEPEVWAGYQRLVADGRRAR